MERKRNDERFEITGINGYMRSVNGHCRETVLARTLDERSSVYISTNVGLDRLFRFGITKASLTKMLKCPMSHRRNNRSQSTIRLILSRASKYGARNIGLHGARMMFGLGPWILLLLAKFYLVPLNSARLKAHSSS